MPHEGRGRDNFVGDSAVPDGLIQGASVGVFAQRRRDLQSVHAAVLAGVTIWPPLPPTDRPEEHFQ